VVGGGESLFESARGNGPGVYKRGRGGWVLVSNRKVATIEASIGGVLSLWVLPGYALSCFLFVEVEGE